MTLKYFLLRVLPGPLVFGGVVVALHFAGTGLPWQAYAGVLSFGLGSFLMGANPW